MALNTKFVQFSFDNSAAASLNSLFSVSASTWSSYLAFSIPTSSNSAAPTSSILYSVPAGRIAKIIMNPQLYYSGYHSTVFYADSTYGISLSLFGPFNSSIFYSCNFSLYIGGVNYFANSLGIYNLFGIPSTASSVLTSGSMLFGFVGSYEPGYNPGPSISSWWSMASNTNFSYTGPLLPIANFMGPGPTVGITGSSAYKYNKYYNSSAILASTAQIAGIQPSNSYNSFIPFSQADAKTIYNNLSSWSQYMSAGLYTSFNSYNPESLGAKTSFYLTAGQSVVLYPGSIANFGMTKYEWSTYWSGSLGTSNLVVGPIGSASFASASLSLSTSMYQSMTGAFVVIEEAAT